MNDIDQIPLTELVRNLQTYEMELGKMGKGGKSRNIALKSIKEESDDSEDEDKDKDEDEDLTFIANEIIKLLQYRKKDKNKAPRKSKSSKKGKNEKPLIQCHEWKDFGHMRLECPNYLMKEKTKNSKGKVLVTTLSDSKSDFFDKDEDECGHYMAFVVTIDKVIMESAIDSDDSSDDEVPKKLTF